MSIPEIMPLSPETFRTLLGTRPTPCVSFYMSTHRPGPEATADPIAYRNLLDRLALTLMATRSRAETTRLLEPWRRLGHEPTFWSSLGGGFAGFATDGEATVVPLEGEVETLAMVGRRFHTLPIVRRLVTTERCRVVTLTSRQARVFFATVSEYGQDRLEAAALDDGEGRVFADGVVTREAIVERVAEEPHRVMHGLGALGDAVHGGFGAREEGEEADTIRFARDVGRIVGRELTCGPVLPLVVIGLPRMASAFVAALPRGLREAEHVAIDPQRMTPRELAHVARERLLTTRHRREVGLAERFLEARAHGRGSGDFTDIARAAAAGRVEVLMVEEGRRERGTIDRRTGVIEFPDAEAADGPVAKWPLADTEEDLYGALAEMVLGHRGTVLSLPAVRMPTRTGVAAIHRWA